MRLDILHVLPDLAVGGAERIAVHLLRQARRARFAAGAVCLGPRAHTPLEAELERLSVPVWFLGKPTGFRPRFAMRLFQHIEQCRPRILHTHRHVLPYLLPTLLLRRDLSCVHTVHNLAEREVPFLTRRLHAIAFRLGVLPVAIAEAVRDSLQRQYSLREIPLVGNGIPIASYAPDPWRRARARADLRCRRDDVVYLSLGRLAPQKNHALLIDAFASGPAHDARARLLIAGAGPLKEALERRAFDLDLLGTRVRFLGPRDDIPELLAAADVVVQASQWEGSPLAVMEAMAAARPVIATAVGGVPELVQHQKTGLLVPAGSRETLAVAMQALLGDTLRRRRLGDAALQHARQHFDSRPMAERYERIYEQLLDEQTALTAFRL